MSWTAMAGVALWQGAHDACQRAGISVGQLVSVHTTANGGGWVGAYQNAALYADLAGRSRNHLMEMGHAMDSADFSLEVMEILGAWWATFVGFGLKGAMLDRLMTRKIRDGLLDNLRTDSDESLAEAVAILDDFLPKYDKVLTDRYVLLDVLESRDCPPIVPRCAEPMFREDVKTLELIAIDSETGYSVRIDSKILSESAARDYVTLLLNNLIEEKMAGNADRAPNLYPVEGVDRGVAEKMDAAALSVFRAQASRKPEKYADDPRAGSW